MRDFPFEACPTAIDLFAYAHERTRQDDPPRHDLIEVHVQDCRECQRALQAFRDDPGQVSEAHPSSVRDIGSMQGQIDAQREALARALASERDKPSPGDVWVTRYPMSGVSGPETLSWLCLVMDHYWREYTREWVLDVVPVTEDPRLAADWSYIVPEDQCDYGAPLVAHVDFFCTAPRNGIVRRVGQLTEHCFAEVMSARSALLSGDPVDEFRCGRLGAESTRTTDAWIILEEALYSLTQQAAVAFGDEGENRTEEGAERSAVHDPTRSTGPATEESVGSSTQYSFRPAQRESPTTPFTIPGNLGGQTHAVIRMFVSGTYQERDMGASATPDTFGALIRLYLDRIYQGDLYRWASDRGCVAPVDVGYLWNLPLPDVALLNGIEIRKYIRRQTGTLIDVTVLQLLSDAVQCLRTVQLADEGIGRRAARTQSPGHDHQA
jgi:hypothetical protein